MSIAGTRRLGLMRGRIPVDWNHASRNHIARLIAVSNVVMFSVLRFAEWFSHAGLERVTAEGYSAHVIVLTMLRVLLGNTLVGALLVWALFALRPEARPWGRRLVMVALTAIVAGSLRVAAMRWIPPYNLAENTLDWLTTVVAVAVAVVSALLVTDFIERSRTAERSRADQEREAARRIAHLEAEEAVRRRMIADRLHGTTQNRLVLVSAGLDRVVEQLADQANPLAALVHDLAEDVDAIRERDIRSLSHDVFPPAADVSTRRALAVLVDRQPAALTAELVTSDAYRRAAASGDPLPLAGRLVLFDTVEEAVTNALKHGEARRVTITLDHRDHGVQATVTNDGKPLPARPIWGGLNRHAARIEARGGRLVLAPAPDGTGVQLSVWLPARANGV